MNGFRPPVLADQTQVAVPMVPIAPVGTRAGPGEVFDSSGASVSGAGATVAICSPILEQGRCRLINGLR